MYQITGTGTSNLTDAFHTTSSARAETIKSEKKRKRKAKHQDDCRINHFSQSEKRAHKVIEGTQPILAIRKEDVITYGDKTYTIIDHVADGGSASVKRGHNENGQAVAIKEFYPDFIQFEQHWKNETEMLRLAAKVKHAVRLLDVFQDSMKGKYLVMPLHDINLLKHLSAQRAMPLDEVLGIGRQLLEFLVDMKNQGLIHGDLKPANIAFKSNSERKDKKIIVLDFGLAVSEQNVNKDRLLQGLPYRAPEVILGMKYDHKIDMWSLGAILFELYLGQPFIKQTGRDVDLETYINTLTQIQLRTRQLPPDSWIENSINGPKTFVKRNEAFDFRLESSIDSSHCSSIETLIHFISEKTDEAEKGKAFATLLKGMLTYENRLSPEQALIMLNAIK